MFYYLMVLIKIVDPLYAHVQQQSFHAANFFLESLKKTSKQNKTKHPKQIEYWLLFVLISGKTLKEMWGFSKYTLPYCPFPPQAKLK